MRLLLFILLSFTICVGSAQIEYSYKSEKIVRDIDDLVGYNFRPFKVEIPGSYEPKEIEAGEFSFGITRTRLYVSGDKDIRGLYAIKNIKPEMYGFKLQLIDPTNPNSWGHLKVILNKLQEVEAIIFKKAKKATEYIFHLPDATASQLQKEEVFFTDTEELTVEDVDSLWGMKIHPYFRVNTADGFQNRIYEMDETVISFEEVVSTKEKKKKFFRKKKKKKKEEPIDELKEESTEEPKESIDETTGESLPAEETKEYVKEYFVKVSAVILDAEGKEEKVDWTFPVKEIEEREDASAKKNEERFQLAIKISKRKEIYLYLKEDRTITSFEAKGIKYLVRGF